MKSKVTEAGPSTVDATPAQEEALIRAEPPTETEPKVPPGATYELRATRLDKSFHEIPTKEHGPEFSLTPSARSHTVSDERLQDKAVLDHGESPAETGPDTPTGEDAAPRPR